MAIFRFSGSVPKNQNLYVYVLLSSLNSGEARRKLPHAVFVVHLSFAIRNLTLFCVCGDCSSEGKERKKHIKIKVLVFWEQNLKNEKWPRNAFPEPGF